MPIDSVKRARRGRGGGTGVEVACEGQGNRRGSATCEDRTGMARWPPFAPGRDQGLGVRDT